MFRRRSGSARREPDHYLSAQPFSLSVVLGHVSTGHRDSRAPVWAAAHDSCLAVLDVSLASPKQNGEGCNEQDGERRIRVRPRAARESDDVVEPSALEMRIALTSGKPRSSVIEVKTLTTRLWAAVSWSRVNAAKEEETGEDLRRVRSQESRR